MLRLVAHHLMVRELSTLACTSVVCLETASYQNLVTIFTAWRGRYEWQGPFNSASRTLHNTI